MGGDVGVVDGRARGGLVKRSRKAREPEVKIRASRAGVRVEKVFDGAVLKPPHPTPPPTSGAVVVQDMYCLFCHSDRVALIWKDDRMRSFRCYRCVDPDTGDWTVFKIERRLPPAAR